MYDRCNWVVFDACKYFDLEFNFISTRFKSTQTHTHENTSTIPVHKFSMSTFERCFSHLGNWIMLCYYLSVLHKTNQHRFYCGGRCVQSFPITFQYLIESIMAKSESVLFLLYVCISDLFLQPIYSYAVIKSIKGCFTIAIDCLRANITKKNV